MAFGTRAAFDPIREIAFGSISGTYAAIGSGLTQHARIVKITNGTNAPMYISTDGVNDEDKIPANGFVLYDFSTNRIRDDGLFIPIGTIFYVKQDTAPTSGSVWVTVIYGEGGV